MQATTVEFDGPHWVNQGDGYANYWRCTCCGAFSLSQTAHIKWHWLTADAENKLKLEIFLAKSKNTLDFLLESNPQHK